MTNEQKDEYIKYLEDKIRDLTNNKLIRINGKKMTERRALMQKLHDSNEMYNQLFSENLKLQQEIKILKKKLEEQK